MASTINLLRLVADATRLRLLLLLEEAELSVAELQEILGMGQSRISSHLAQLKRAGMVADRRSGKNVYYGLPRSWQALAHTLITLLPPLTVADLGAGEGTLSQLLAKNARKVIAVDSSPKMVEFGSKLARKHGFKKLEYRLGDIQDPPIAKESVDLAIFSQALHHAIRPERALAGAYRMLKKNGRVVILDLLSHRFEKARELYLDHWLGFSEIQLHEFLEEAGFKNIDVKVVGREKQSPHFQTVLATGVK